jgi:hypothetical protein
MTDRIKHTSDLAPNHNLWGRSWRTFSINTLWRIIKDISGVTIDEKSRENLEAIDNQLTKTSMVLYGYHASKSDVALPIFLRKHLDNLLMMLYPTAITHSEGMEGKFLHKLGSMTDSKFLPVVRKNDEANYDQKTKDELSEELKEQTKIHLLEPGHLYGAAPLGSRLKVLDSAKVNNGFAKVARMRQAPIAPLAFTVNSENRHVIRIGEIMTPPKPDADIEEATNFYMWALAKLLEPRFRGDYQ